MKIVLVGGHITPAVSFIDFVKANHPEVDLVFIGRLYARYKTKQPSHERELVMQRGITFLPFHAGKLDYSSIREFLRNIWYMLTSLPKAISLLRNEKPNAILAFGGYLAVPICIAGKLLRIRVVTHEQTRSLGFANALLAPFVNAVAVSHPEAVKPTLKHKMKVTGNLLRPQVLAKTAPKPSWWKNQSTDRILYITGGSQGSEIINCLIAQVLPTLTKHWRVVHQCGAASLTRNYLEEATRAAHRLTPAQRKKYHVQEWFSEQELAWIYNHARATIARAGANTVDELRYHAVPSILIPLPFAHNNEQKHNAEAMKQLGGALILEQKDASTETLLSELNSLDKQALIMRHSLYQHRTTGNAAAALFALVSHEQQQKN